MMDAQRKKGLMQAYKAAPTYYGVIQITNRQSGKIFIDTVPNIKNRLFFYQTNLNKNFYRNTPLQRDWNELGADQFSFQILWKKENDDVMNMHDELKQLKREWLLKLQPFGERGYNKRPLERN